MQSVNTVPHSYLPEGQMYRFHTTLWGAEENVLPGRLKARASQHYEYLNNPSVKIKSVSLKIQDSLHYHILFYRQPEVVTQ